MLLIPGRAMGEYGIEEDGVIHCVITEARTSTCHLVSGCEQVARVLTTVTAQRTRLMHRRRSQWRSKGSRTR